MGKRRRSLLMNSNVDRSTSGAVSSEGGLEDSLDGYVADTADDLDATLDTGDDDDVEDDSADDDAADADETGAEAAGAEEAGAEAPVAEAAAADALAAPVDAEQPVAAPEDAKDLANAAKDSNDDLGTHEFTKDVATGNPAAAREASPKEAAFPKAFAEEEDDDWFLRTGQPAPPREVEAIEEDEDSVLAAHPTPAVSPAAGSYAVVLGLLGVAGLLLVVGLLVILFS